MSEKLSRRILGPSHVEMGGNPTGSYGGGGGGGSSLTITNNVDGYILKATGEANRVEGISALQYDNSTTTLSSSANMYISGSSNYLYLHGIDDTGKNRIFQVEISGSMLKIVNQER